MRALAAIVSVAALLSGAMVASAQEKKNPADTKAKGQSERPADPKHIEQESLSHNADKPNPNAKKADGTSGQTADKKKQK